MTEPKMIDRLAAAAWAHLEHAWQTRASAAFIDVEAQLIDGKVDMPALIGAVLAAMPEATEEMHEAGMAVVEGHGITHHHALPALRGAYRAMINAALLRGS